jgi:hypothetical protein
MPENVGLPLHEQGYELKNVTLTVLEPFDVLIHLGSADSNTYIGNSKALRSVYFRARALPGDEISNLHGGTFFTPKGLRLSFDARTSAMRGHIFDNYTRDRVEWPKEKLSEPRPFVGSVQTLYRDDALLSLSFEDEKRIGDVSIEGGMRDIVITRFADDVLARMAPDVRAIAIRTLEQVAPPAISKFAAGPKMKSL